MQKKIKVYDFSRNGRLFSWTRIPFEPVTNPANADIIIFPGGADIHPRLYGQNYGNATGYVDSSQDMNEVAVYKRFVGKIPMFGICRGMQLLSALNGAFLVQDMHHPGRHDMFTDTGDVISTNSLHHQQVCLTKLPKSDYKLLGWTKCLSKYHTNGFGQDYKFSKNYKEPEAVFFPKTKCLAVQFHPEMMTYAGNEAAIEWTKNQIQKYLLNQ